MTMTHRWPREKFLHLRFAPLILLTFGIATPAHAQEATVYEYDRLGRLKAISVTGGPANGSQTKIEYDPAGNRQRYTTAGARDRPPLRPVLVFPLNGYTVIPVVPR